jgi:hypothetical protein
MEPKDRVDGLMKLAEFRTKHRKQRRQVEWRVSLGIWASLTAGIIADSEGKLKPPLPLLGIGLALITLMHFWWVGSNYVRNQRDADRAYDRVGDAEEELGVERTPGRKTHHWYEFLWEPVPAAEWFVTIALALIWWFLAAQVFPART